MSFDNKMDNQGQDNYYDSISAGYDELHSEEQAKKIGIIKKKIKIIPSYKLLDVGCGTGLSSVFKCNVTGIEPSEKMLKIAKAKGIKAIIGKAEELPFKDSSFDIVISLSAAQNFNDIKKSLIEIKRVGNNIFAISIIKKSGKTKEFEIYLFQVFEGFNIEKVEEEKDYIYFIDHIS